MNCFLHNRAYLIVHQSSLISSTTSRSCPVSEAITHRGGSGELAGRWEDEAPEAAEGQPVKVSLEETGLPSALCLLVLQRPDQVHMHPGLNYK